MSETTPSDDGIQRDDETTDELPAELKEAMEAVRGAPDDPEGWDRLEDEAASAQRPDEVAELFLEVLGTELSVELANEIGQRASNFIEEWFGEDSKVLAKILERVLEIDRVCDWAFQRLTVAYTVAGKWDELLTLYDRAIDAAEDRIQRKSLLDEAINVAKDFAQAPDRAIGYLRQMLEITPKDSRLVSSLERLLERQERWEDLAQLWEQRLEHQSGSELIEQRIRIATCHLDKLAAPEPALRQIEAVLQVDEADATKAVELLERIADWEEAEGTTRRKALEHLKDNYESAGQSAEVVRVLEAMLAFSEDTERPGLLRELGERLIGLDRHSDAMPYFARLLELEPTAVDAHQRLQELAGRTGDNQAFAEALEKAGSGCEQVDTRVSLLMEAAKTRRVVLDDPEGATGLYRRVTEESEAKPASILQACRQLNSLLESAGKTDEQLDVLERLVEHEPEASERRDILGRAARLADSLGQTERALNLWSCRVEEEASDVEALGAIIVILKREERWEPLIEVLLKRAEAPVSKRQSREDMVAVARLRAKELEDIEGAIATWLEVRERFGEDDEIINSLAELYAKSGQWEEYASILDGAAERESSHIAGILARLGEVCRDQLTSPDRAVAFYQRSLRIVPGQEGALTGLRAMLDDDEERRGEIAEILALAYEQTESWEQVIELLEYRLDVAGGFSAQARLLRETASIQEEHLENTSEALQSYCRALVLTPWDDSLELEITRLGETTGEWEAVVDAYSEAGESAFEEERQAQLRFEAGRLAEEHLEDAEVAFDSYWEVFDETPDNVDAAVAVVRTASQCSKWDSIAEVLVGCTQAKGELVDEVIETIEQYAETADAFETLTTELEEQLTGDDADDLDGEVARALDRLSARWLEEKREDSEAALQAYLRASRRAGPDDDVLVQLARLQRENPDQALFDTLIALAGLREDARDLDPLHEAAKVAIDVLEDVNLRRETLERLYRTASRLWRRGLEVSGEVKEGDAALWALDHLVEILLDEGENEKAVNLFVDASQLPVEKERCLDLQRRAAAVTSEKMGDHQRSMVLYRSILADAPEDVETIRAFQSVCRAAKLDLELLSLLKRELELCQEGERRLELRLEIAEQIGKFENLGGRLEVLKENLAEQPGHEPSIDALVAVHEDKKRYEDLVELLTEQADILEGRDEIAASAGLWMKAAELSEKKLGDKERAIGAHRRVQKLTGAVDSLDALARLQSERGEHAAAARWLERRLTLTQGEERLSIIKQLAAAHLAADQVDEAIEKLERALQENPEAADFRNRLAELYRSKKRWEPLAQMLTDAAPYIDDLETLGAYAKEAAELFSRLGSPDRAIGVLEKASEQAPEDHGIRRMLAEGLIAADRVDEGRTMLEELIEAYGRRRNPERAFVHFLLAKALKAQGDLDGALKQLDLASKMDVRNTKIAALLGQLSVEAGQLDRAERTYRALLMVVRRQQDEDVDVMGAAEVLYELYQLARAREKEDQAQELLRSVLQTASESAVESARFRRAMLERDEPDLLLEGLEMRVDVAAPGADLAFALAQFADVLETKEERRKEALEARFKALQHKTDAWDIHDAARTLAKDLGESEKYAEMLRALIDTVRREEEAELASQLLLRLGAVLEQDLEDFDGAAKAYARVEALGHHVVEARVALAKVAGARGDSSEETRLLRALVNDESLSESARSDARYRLAELQLSTSGASAEGLTTLEAALEQDAYYERACSILEAACKTDPDDSERLALYGRVARAASDQEHLLDYLEKRTKLDDAKIEEAKEAVEILEAREDEQDKLEAMLLRAVEIAERSGEGLRIALWAPAGLARLAHLAGELTKASEWLNRAADATESEEESFNLWLQAASFATEAEDHEQALTVLGRLLERDPGNSKLWLPALEAARAIGDEERLVALVEQTLGVVTEVEDRNGVRLQHALFLLTRDGREPDAAKVLLQILDDESEHEEAARLLADLYERVGFDEELSVELREQLDQARDSQEVEAIRESSLKLGELLSKIRRAEAMDVYRQALEWLPDDREISSRLLALLGPDDDPRERVELMERPLKLEEGEVAAELALRLADEWGALEDEAGVERVLRVGYEACPEHQALRERLEGFYEQRGDWQNVVQLMVSEATRLENEVQSVDLLRRSAAIYKDSLFDQNGAIKCLAQARSYAPDNMELLHELVAHRIELSDYTTAINEVAEVLERFEADNPARPDLLNMRAELHRATGEDAEAVAALEEAYSISGAQFLEPLQAGLEQLRTAAATNGDYETERNATLRLVALALENGQRDTARDGLNGWLQRSAEDRDALYQLLELDESEEQWQAVAETCEKLVGLEGEEAQVKMVLRLADACDRLENAAGARAGLERVHQDQPQVREVRDRLWALYEHIGAKRELATMLLAEALANEDEEEKFEQLQKAGNLFLESGDDGVEQAIAPLEEAVRIKPDDHPTNVLLVDAYTSTNRFAEAGKLLEQAIAAKGSRRSPQLAELQHRMARLAAVAGDKRLQLQWLNVAFDSDRRNGQIVADLASLAMELGEHDLALSALRVVTVSKVESPLSRARAFLMQAQIANQRGEGRRAMMWAHRAHEEDPELVEAAELLEQLGGN